MNLDLLRSTWKQAFSYGDDFVVHFYNTLFRLAPELRPLFGADMRPQRRHIVKMLHMVIAGVDRPDVLVPQLRELGARHHSYGVVAEHFPMVARALKETLAHFLGDDWTDEAALTWDDALTAVAKWMIEGLQSADRQPAIWPVTIYETARNPEGDAVRMRLAVPDGYQAAVGDVVPVSIPDEPGTRVHCSVVAWTADHTLLVVESPVTFDEPATVELAQLGAGEQVHLGAPTVDLIEGGVPDGH